VRVTTSANPQFFGFSFASALSIYYLQQENKIASSLLVASVEELQQSTGKVGISPLCPDILSMWTTADLIQITSHLERLQTVEKDLAALKNSGAGKEDVGKVRAEMKKVYVSLESEIKGLPSPA
jgi:hypothetical protein